MNVRITKPEGWLEESFHVRSEDNWEWMDVSIRSKGSMIHVKFNSSFVSGAYNWNSCGDDVDWREWLLDTDFDYFMGKMFGNSYRVFSLEKTIEGCIQTVQEHVSEWGLNPVVGEGLRRALLQIQDRLSEVSPEDPYRLVDELYGLDHYLFSDAPEGYIRRQDRPDLVEFWEVLWRPFIEGVQQ